MNQSLQMPFIETSMPSGKVQRWNKQPGEPFAFGETLCIILVEDALFLSKPRSAGRLTASKPRKRWTTHEIRAEPVGKIEFEVVAAAPGIMRDHVVAIGESAEVGSVLAVLQTTEGEYIPTPVSDVGDLPPLRAAANPVDVEGN